MGDDVGLTEAQARDGLREVLELVEGRPSHHHLEQLGHAHRWLDEPGPAAAAYRAAVEDLQRRVDDRGRDTSADHGRRGGLL